MPVLAVRLEQYEYVGEYGAGGRSGRAGVEGGSGGREWRTGVEDGSGGQEWRAGVGGWEWEWCEMDCGVWSVKCVECV
jgi:hypothetical protein